MSEPAGRSFLLLRRGGVLWGIDNAAVTGLTRQAAGFRVALGAALGNALGALGDGPGESGSERSLAADEILCVVDGLRVKPLAPAVRRFWPVAAAGMAVHGEMPLVVVDLRRPPHLLRPDGGRDEGE